MTYTLIKKERITYLEVSAIDPPLETEQNALNLVALCGEKDTRRLMLLQGTLSQSFFELKTGAAGAIMQKFINYSIKTAIVVPDQSGFGARFQELKYETGKGSQYRFFSDKAQAESWLLL
jgi:hypothetical protein